MKISDLKVCGCDKPIALTEKVFVFSFILDYCDGENTKYKLLISKNDKVLEEDTFVFQSKTIDYRLNSTISVPSSLFEVDTDYIFAIKCADEIVYGHFSKGLSKDDFSARWITRCAISDVAPLFIKQIDLCKKDISQARLYISGLGYFVAFLNGQRVGDDGYVPQVSDYNDRPLDGLFETFPIGTRKSAYYLCYDVKQQLRQSNSLAVIVGNGWYKNREKPNEGNFYYGEPRLLFELRVKYTDGSDEVFISDESTLVADSNYLRNTLYTGEIIDFNKANRLMIEEYKANELFKVKTLKDLPGEFLWQKEPSDKCGEILTPKSIIYTSKYGYLIDFGQNHSGVLDLTIQGPKGTHVTLIYGENKTDDNDVDVYSSSWGGHIQTDELYLSEKEDHFAAEFTIHGYRYVKITSNKEINIIDVKSKFIYSFVNMDGDFTCDNQIINQIYKNYKYTQLSNLHGNVPTDCPHRERRGFLGDGHVSMLAAMYAFDMRLTYKKWIKDIRDAQSITGYMPHTAPFAAGGGGPGFGSGCIIVPYNYYRFYGDVDVLEQGYDGMINWIKYLNTRHDGDGIIVREEKGWCIGEWFNPTLINLDIPFANTYFFILSIQLVLKIAQILGKTNDLSWLNALLEFETKAFMDKYYDYNTHLFCNGGKGACFFGLDLGLLDEKEAKLCLEKGIEHIIKDLDYHLETGIFGTPLMFKILTKYNRRDILEKIITGTTYPSYGYMIKCGATTLWEGFEERDGPSYLLRDGYPQTGYGVTHNHPMLGSVCEWFYRYIAGLDINHLGVDRVVEFNPYLTGDIHKAKASKETAFGKASIEYAIEQGIVNIDLEIPPSCKGVLSIDALVEPTINGKPFTDNVLSSGKYHIIGGIKK